MFIKYNNKRTGKVTSWNEKNASKPELQFIKDNKHLGYTEDELKEAHGIIVAAVKSKGDSASGQVVEKSEERKKI